MGKYYNDSDKTSEWITQMRILSNTFKAIFFNLERIDWSLAEKNQHFSQIHKKSTEMIPEWEEKFDLIIANKLKKSILEKVFKKNINYINKRPCKP
jgi:hypothetical protein